MSAEDSLRLKQLFSELSDISDAVPTDYYMDAINYNLSKQNIKELDIENVDEFVNSDDFQEILDNDEAFKDWFVLNHVERQRWDSEAKSLVTAYIPTRANMITVPSDARHYETTTIKDLQTGKDIILPGVPSARHSRFEVKDEYRTIPFGKNKEILSALQLEEDPFKC